MIINPNCVDGVVYMILLLCYNLQYQRSPPKDINVPQVNLEASSSKFFCKYISILHVYGYMCIYICMYVYVYVYVCI